MRRLITLLVVIAALLTGCAGGTQQQQSQPQSLKFDTTVQGRTYSVEAQPLDSADGYSYTISINGHRYIHQTIIPVVQGLHHFETVEDALNTGKVVIAKMMHSNDLPSLTTGDLIMLGILSKDSTLNKRK